MVYSIYVYDSVVFSSFSYYIFIFDIVKRIVINNSAFFFLTSVRICGRL